MIEEQIFQKVFWIDDLKHNDNTFGEPYNTREKAQEQIELAYKFKDGSTFKEGDLVIREEFVEIDWIDMYSILGINTD